MLQTFVKRPRGEKEKLMPSKFLTFRKMTKIPFSNKFIQDTVGKNIFVCYDLNFCEKCCLAHLFF